jgi:hypothetical protein
LGLQCLWPTFSMKQLHGKGVGSMLSNANSESYCFLPTVIHQLELFFKNCLEGYIPWTTPFLEDSLQPKSRNKDTEIDIL